MCIARYAIEIANGTSFADIADMVVGIDKEEAKQVTEQISIGSAATSVASFSRSKTTGSSTVWERACVISSPAELGGVREIVKTSRDRISHIGKLCEQFNGMNGEACET